MNQIKEAKETGSASRHTDPTEGEPAFIPKALFKNNLNSA